MLKPEISRKVLEDRLIETHASLDKIDGGERKRYSFHAVMAVHAPIERTHRILTDYSLYSKMIPYIDEADYSPATHLMKLRGGIWAFRLASQLRFSERSDRWIHFDIIGGHFTGLAGDIFFESAGEKGTLVYMKGEQQGSGFPPAFVIERGAEIVFSFTARKMRSYIESQSEAPQEHKQDWRGQPEPPPTGGKIDGEVPKPRSHL